MNTIILQGRTLNNKAFTIEVRPEETILELQKKVYSATDISPGSQRIIFANKQLNEEKTVDYYNMVENSVFYVLKRLRGC